MRLYGRFRNIRRGFNDFDRVFQIMLIYVIKIFKKTARGVEERSILLYAAYTLIIRIEVTLFLLH